MLLCTTKLWLNYKDAIHCSPVTSRVDALLSGHKGPGIEAKKNDMMRGGGKGKLNSAAVSLAIELFSVA
jgi:hypothetical protein